MKLYIQFCGGPVGGYLCELETPCPERGYVSVDASPADFAVYHNPDPTQDLAEYRLGKDATGLPRYWYVGMQRTEPQNL